MSGRQPNLNVCNSANQPVADDFSGLSEGPLRTLPGTRLPNSFIHLHRFHDGLLLSDGASQGLLAVDVLLVSCCFSSYERMPGIRHCQHHSIDVCARNHLAEIMIRFAVLITVMAVNFVESRMEIVLVDVTSGDYLAILFTEKCLRVARPLHAPPNNSKGNSLGRSCIVRSAKSAGRDERVRSQSDSRSG